ncbi:CHAT domain-containing protein [Phormidium tenue FACHB-886]|nr:CHAT domain-containing protein [Phormidium tenue FACHB-886]
MKRLVRFRFFRKRFYRLIIVFIFSFFFVTHSFLPGFSQEISVPVIAQSLNQAKDQTNWFIQGRELYDARQFSEAVTVWQQAIAFYQQQHDQPHEAIALTFLALTYQHLGRWVEADTAIDRSIALLTSASHSSAEEPQSGESVLPLLAQAFNVRGQIEFASGQPELALETWQQATRLYQQLGDAIGTTGSLLNQAKAMEAAGFYRRACNTVLTGLGIAYHCDGTEKPDLPAILQILGSQQDLQIRGLGLRSLGNVFRSMGYLAQSEQLLRQGLEIATTLNSVQDVRTTLLSLGNTEQALYNQTKDLYDRTQLEGDRDQAIHQAWTALDHYREVISSSTNLDLVEILTVQAMLQQLRLLIDLQQWLQALHLDTEANALQSQIQDQTTTLLNGKLDQLPPSRTALYAYVNLAQSLIKLAPGEERVKKVLTIALQQSETLQDQRAKSYVLGTLGHWYEHSEELSTLSQAEKFTTSALGIAQSVQAWEIAYQWQWQLGRIYKAQSDPARAIAHYQVAVETLKSVRANLQAIDAEVQFSFRDDVEPVYRQWVELLVGRDQEVISDQARLKQVIQSIDALQLSELENFLRCNLTESITIGDTELDPTAAILYPIILDQQLAVVLRLPNSEQLQLHKIPLPKVEVDQQLKTLRQELEKPYLSQTGLALAQQVYDWIIRPFQSALETNQVTTLVFVLDGAFRNVPMAVLHDGQRFLIETYAAALMPGLQLIEPKPLPKLPLPVLLFGLSQVRPDFPPHQNFAPLSHVETELDKIQAETPSQTVLNQRFTSSTFQQLLQSRPFPIVHLATHGQFSSDLEETFVLAWDKRIDVNLLSYLLQNRSESNLQSIELLVLSACKTAQGDSRAALGLAGLALQSGARSTVASLWFIDDQATAELMGHFYQALLNPNSGVTRAEALRLAQIALLQSSDYRAPFYWAPYVLVGSWL